MFTNPSTPNLADFTTYVYAQGVPSADLPSNSDYLVWSLGYAQDVALQAAPGTGGSYVGTVLTAAPYVIAVYNLGLHHLIKIAQDVSPSTFFATQRANFKLNQFVAGPIIASADQSTSESLLAPDWMKTMTMQSLDLLKTPWGRMYLEYAQMYGPNIVGVS